LFYEMKKTKHHTWKKNMFITKLYSADWPLNKTKLVIISWTLTPNPNPIASWWYLHYRLVRDLGLHRSVYYIFFTTVQYCIFKLMDAIITPIWLEVRVVVFNVTFNNISIISWRSILLVDETGIPGEKHRPVASH
jgi:hypothetical protein